MSEPSPPPVGGQLPDGAATAFSGAMSYSDYLALDRLLDCQRPLSSQHDEMLFVIIHQTTELWMKLVIHELDAARRHIRADDLQPAFKMLSRVSRIQAQLIQSWDVLSTLTPSDYMSFRDVLGTSSGFQSHQYREVEFMLGNRNPAMLKPFEHDTAIHTRLAAALDEPGIYDEAIRLLARSGHTIDEAELNRDFGMTRVQSASVEAAWLAVYVNAEANWQTYELAEKLVDMEDWFRQWRFRHLTTVERIIGRKRGTGGTAGVDYLASAVNIRLFPELWAVRTSL